MARLFNTFLVDHTFNDVYLTHINVNILNKAFTKLYFIPQIRTMEQGEQDGVTDVLSDSALIPYLPESGVVVYIDYLTPTFHISANLMLAVIR